MILILGLKFKSLNQSSYDNAVHHIKNSLINSSLALFGSEEQIIFYGTYTRYFVSDIYPCSFPLKIQRIFCVNSGKTHALIPSCLVPYSSIPLDIQLEVVDADDDNELMLIANRYLLDLNRLLFIRNSFLTYWHVLTDWLVYPIDSLVIKAVQLVHRQFMQSRGNAFLYPPT